MMDKFLELLKIGISNETREKIRLYIEALKELEEIERRQEFLEEVINENNDLSDYLWKTADGEYFIIDEISDEHLRNIINYLTWTRREIPKKIKYEFKRRKLNLIHKPKQLFSSIDLESMLADDDDDDSI